MRLFAYALLGALALCDSAWCVEQEPAIEALKREVNVLRRSGGLYDPRQSALLNQLVDLHSLQGDIDEAVAALAYMESVSERTDGRLSRQHAATLAGIAGWQCRLGEFESGRQRFRRSIERLRNEHDEVLIGALLGLARCSFDELAAEGIATSPESLDSYRGPVLRRNRMSIGSPAFQYRVQKILRPEGDQALRDAARLAESATLAPERYVEIEFTVHTDGRVGRERVLLREPGKSAADETLQALQAARYRPRMVDGKALDTEGVRLRQAF